MSAEAETITRASKSNLALAFVVLPRGVRRDMNVFYSFCRVVDDLADEPGLQREDRLAALAKWKQCVAGPQPNEPKLAAVVRDLIERHRLPVEHFIEIIHGCEMDVHGTVFETWDELRLYCHRVASVVGLVSVEIFGARDPQAKSYAANLGLALQLTNIIRDVGHDYANEGRVYLPRADMDQFGYDVGGLAMQQEDEMYRALMAFEAQRAFALYESARAALPAGDRKALVAAEIMRRVYQRLLRKMQRDGFRTLTRRYRLKRWEKMWCVLAGWLNRTA
ncbi:MAG: squalene/phytoene synthase family protein [Chthoniobacteraceae bacterium]